MKKFLFVCTGNTCRSAMAEGIFNALAEITQLDLRATSCGLFAFGGDAATQLAQEAAARYGADLSAHRARPLTAYAVEEADAVYCMTAQHRAALLRAVPTAAHKVFCLGERDISDPFGGDRAVYVHTAGEIARAVRRLLEREEQV